MIYVPGQHYAQLLIGRNTIGTGIVSGARYGYDVGNVLNVEFHDITIIPEVTARWRYVFKGSGEIREKHLTLPSPVQLGQGNTPLFSYHIDTGICPWRIGLFGSLCPFPYSG